MLKSVKPTTIYFFLLALFFGSCKPNPPKSKFKSLNAKALLATEFSNIKQFKEDVKIDYFNHSTLKGDNITSVILTYKNNGDSIISKLTSGTSQDDIIKAKDGSLYDQVDLITKSPYSIRSRVDLAKVYMLARRRPKLYDIGDVAFYDLAEASLWNIIETKKKGISAKESGEKGYINTFNHVTAQAIITAIFGEELADFMGDIHERFYMPELTTGKFSEEQKTDTINFPVDNYVDLVNNEIGQELGILLSTKYHITRQTIWSKDLLCNFLNDIQDYYSWSFDIGFKAYQPNDKLILRYADKINQVIAGKYQTS